MRLPRLPAVFATLALLVVPVACSGSSSDDGGGEEGGGGEGSTETTTSTTPESEVVDGAAFAETVAYLADEGDGRDNGTAGSRRAQERIVEELEAFAEPLPGGDGFLHPFDVGTNILGVIEGTATSSDEDEVVVLGAHYDGLGHDCDAGATADPADEVCDGAGDNAAGTAAVIEIGRRLAADPPARTVILALWDAEEDTLLGSQAAVESGVFDLEQVVTYLNWDIQGINLLPALVDSTIVVGAETGGPALQDAVAAGTGSTDLEPVDLSLLFGQGRSDHATFADAGVPVTFFSDGTSGCYHTVQDDMEHLDIEKLGRQIDMGEVITREVAGTGDRPTFAADTPAATFADAESILAMVDRAAADLDLLPTGARADV